MISNESADPLTIRRSDIATFRVVIPEHSWRTFNARVGTSLVLTDGACVAAKDEPILFVNH